jgi:hypothetical protein
LAAAANGFLVQTADLRHKLDATMTIAFGFDRRIPATLLLVQATQQHIDLMVQLFVWVFLRTLTYRAFTLMNWTLLHLYPLLTLSALSGVGYYILNPYFENPATTGCYF